MNMYPIYDEPPKRRLLDWRFLAAFTVLLLVTLLCYAAWRNYELREAEAAHKDVLLEQLAGRSAEIVALERELAELTDRIAVLTDRAREDRQEAREERRSAARERSRLLRQQERMLELLRSQGVEYVPTYRTVASGGPRHVTTVETTTSPPTAGKSGKTPPGNAHGLRR